MQYYKIVLAEDYIPLRQCIKQIIHENDTLIVVGEVDDGIELLKLVGNYIPDMVIVNISMSRLHGLEATTIVKKFYPEVKILILTMHKEKEYLAKAMVNGADGFLLKQSMREELLPAIQAIRSDKIYISQFFKKVSQFSYFGA